VFEMSEMTLQHSERRRKRKCKQICEYVQSS